MDRRSIRQEAAEEGTRNGERPGKPYGGLAHRSMNGGRLKRQGKSGEATYKRKKAFNLPNPNSRPKIRATLY